MHGSCYNLCTYSYVISTTFCRYEQNMSIRAFCVLRAPGMSWSGAGKIAATIELLSTISWAISYKRKRESLIKCNIQNDTNLKIICHKCAIKICNIILHFLLKLFSTEIHVLLSKNNYYTFWHESFLFSSTTPSTVVEDLTFSVPQFRYFLLLAFNFNISGTNPHSIFKVPAHLSNCLI